MTLQQYSYAPLPGYADPVPKVAQLPPTSGPAVSSSAAPAFPPTSSAAPLAAREHYAYDEGEMYAPQQVESYMPLHTYEGYKELSPNNTMLIAMSVTTGGLLLIILLIILFTKPPRRG